MADTEFDAFTLVTALQTTDLLLAKRGSGGINFTLATLFGGVPDGTVGAPGLRFINDQDTGLFRAGADILDVVTGGATRVRVNASGNVSVGTNNDKTRLNVSGTASAGAPTPGVTSGSMFVSNNDNAYGLLCGVNAGDGASWLQAQRTDGAGTAYNLWLNPSGGNVGIGTSSPSQKLHVAGTIISNNLLLQGDGSNGYIRPTNAGNLYLGASNATIVVITSTLVAPNSDNAIALGDGSLRWTTVYATTGTINTSDEREKKWRGSATPKELAAANEMIGELGFFQWLDAIEEKGARKARYHFGVRAQRVWAIMAKHGLVDPIGDDGRPGRTKYAFLCFDEWDDEWEDERETVTVVKQREVTRELEGLFDAQGNRAVVTEMEDYEKEEERLTGRKLLVRAAGNRYGVRTDQLTLFLMAGQEARMAEQDARQAALDARLAALEAKAA